MKQFTPAIAAIAALLAAAFATPAPAETSHDIAAAPDAAALAQQALNGEAPAASYYRYGRFFPPRPPAQVSTCAGVRGNGANLFAHYGVLARQVEEYGPVTCAAGGSSGAITTFILESIWANPAVHFCRPDRLCGRRARDARIALLLKSFVGLSEAGLFEDAATVNALLQGVLDDDLVGKMQGPNPMEGVEAFLRLLRDLGPLINPELITLLESSPNPVFHALDIIDGLQKGVQFIVDDPRVFLRTSVLDFDAVADLFGLYGSFYANYGPADVKGVRAWMRACARPGLGLTWEEVAELPGTEGRTCGETLVDLFNAYRERVAAEGGESRINDRIGEYLPVFGVTGVITGRSIALWEEARDAWIAATPIPFEPDFADIGVGYWGKKRELRRMMRRLDRRFFDLNSMQFTALNKATWREILAASPAEPGFSPGVPLSAGPVSVGGWADPLRVLPLEALGARATIAVNRRDGVGSFTIESTRLLNADDAAIEDLYGVDNPDSSFSIGLERATGVWCTDWDGQNSVPDLLFNDAYSSPLITDFRRFLRPRFDYQNVGPEFEIFGCNPAD